MNLQELIASYQPLDPQTTITHSDLINLRHMMGHQQLIYIDDNLGFDGKPLSVDGEYVNTQNHVAVVLYDERLQPSNLAFYPLDQGKPFLLHKDGRISNFICGQDWQAGKPFNEVMITHDLQQAKALAVMLDNDLQGRAIIAPFDDDHWQIIRTVKAMQQPITVFTDYRTDKQGRQVKTQLQQAFIRCNVTLVITQEPLADLIAEVFDYQQLLKDSEIQTFDHYPIWHNGQAPIDPPIKYDNGRFELYQDGLYFVKYEFDSEKSEYHKQHAIKLSSPLWVKASIRSKDSNAWGMLLSWHDRDNKPHQWAMPSEMLQGDSKEYRQILAYQGLDISPSQRARNYLTAYLQSYTTPNRALSVNKTGWHGNSYVLPNQVIAQTTDEPIVLQVNNPLQHGYQEQGTLQDWQQKVSIPIADQSRIAFAVSCAFAGQLLELINEKNGGGFHFWGNSSMGKSITLAIAGSVWGNDMIKSWRNTDNAMENIALLHNDNVLCLDEINEADIKTIGKTIYMLANGQGKGRMNGKTGNNRHLNTWRVIVLSNGEQTLETYLRQAGEPIKAGQEVRLASIEADTGNHLGIFDSLVIADTPSKQAEILRQNAHQYHGTAGIAWLNHLTQNKATITEQIHQYNRQFLDQYPNLTGQAKRVANRFALVATAGELATKAGITGWQSGQAMTAVKACFDNWLSHYGDVGNLEEKQIIQSIQGFIQQHGLSRFCDWYNDYQTRIPNLAGFYRNEHPILYLIFPTVFNEEVCKRFNKKQVLDILNNKGVLKKNHGYQFKVNSTHKTKKGRFYAIKGDVLEIDID